MRARWLIVLGMVYLVGCNFTQNTPPPTATPAPVFTCDQLITTALTLTDQSCNALNRNQACYGNHQVTAEFQPNASVTFVNSGDKTTLDSLKRLITAPFDEAAQTWGIAILEAQATLPDTLPGQNLTFILFGETSLNGVSSTMQAVTFSTGIGRPRCAAVPASAVLVQSPDGTKVSMKFNGASVTLGSTVYVTATSNGKLTLATLQGSVSVEAFGKRETIPLGAQVSLPLGASDGLQVVGPPSPPEPYNLADISLAPLVLLKRRVDLPQPIAPSANTPQPATAVATQPGLPQPACIVRADWTGTYVIQPGDTLGTIAQRFNVSLDALQQGNCIDNPNLISAGQGLRVPFQPPVVIPSKTPTRTPTPTPKPGVKPPVVTPEVIPPPSDTPQKSSR